MYARLSLLPVSLSVLSCLSWVRSTELELKLGAGVAGCGLGAEGLYVCTFINTADVPEFFYSFIFLSFSGISLSPNVP